MRILHILPYFYPAVRFGGPVTVVYGISKELARRGHEVIVYTSDVDNDYSRVSENIKEIDGIEVHYFRNLTTKTTPYNVFIVPSMVSTLKKTIRSFDVVHIHGYRSFQNPKICKLSKSKAVPYIIHAHGTLPRIMAWQRLKWVYDVLFGYRLLRDASKVVALSQLEAQQYKAMGVPEEKIAIIPNGIDLSEYANLPPKGSFKKKFNIDEDKRIVLYLGRIHRSKGIDFLIKAYAHLTNDLKFRDALLVIAGPDDGYLTEAKRLVNSLRVADKVVFTGMLSEKEKISAYVDSSITVNVEPRNVFGLVPLEAAACSTPVVVSKGNAISENIHQGKFGFSVEYNDIAGLAEIMRKVISDDVLRNEMGDRGRRFVFENCNWANVVTKLEKAYEETVNFLHEK